MGKERREFERVDSMISVRYISKTGQINGYSFTRDLSKGGIGCAVSGKIPEGTKLDLTIIIREKEQKKIPVTAEVVWSRRNSEHWKSRYSAGLRFVEISPEDKEALFDYVKRHRWIKSDFERSLEENKVPVLGGKGELLI